MNKTTAITCAFLDIGGVLLTDGWDHLARRRAANNFKLEWAEMEDRHHRPFEIFEAGRITLEECLTQPGTPGSLALERMQKDADRTQRGVYWRVAEKAEWKF